MAWRFGLKMQLTVDAVDASNVRSNFVGRSLLHSHLPPSAAEYLPVPPLISEDQKPGG